MPEDQDAPLQDRMARLEAAVADLQEQLHQVRQAQASKDHEPASAPGRTRSPRDAAGRRPPRSTPLTKATGRIKASWNSEEWLNRIGIGLLLFGLAFLFKYSVDQGWLVPPIRLVFGVVLGLLLLTTGGRLRSNRQRLGQALMGGGIATFYVTIFAAYQLYGLVPYPVAFAFMFTVTLAAFFLAVHQQDALLSVIGTLGGLGTPFLLYTEGGSLPGLVGYTCLILIGAAQLYLFRGWRSLLLSAYAGGWVVFAVALLRLEGDVAPLWRAALQAGVIAAWLTFWLIPVLRAYVESRSPEQLPASAKQDHNGFFYVRHPELVLTVFTPFVAFTLSWQIWSLDEAFWGLVTLGASLLYALAAAWLLRRGATALGQVHSFTATLLLTLALLLLFEGNVLLLALAAEGAALHGAARALADKRLQLTAHVLSLGIILWLCERIFMDAAAAPILLNTPALTDAAALACVALGGVLLRAPAFQRWYLVAAHVLFLGWLLRELTPLPSGQAYASIAWGAYAVILLVIGLRQDVYVLRNTALATLLALVGKLFLVDLAKLDAVWRILLFLSLGGLFLLLSYYVPNLWKPAAAGEGERSTPR